MSRKGDPHLAKICCTRSPHDVTFCTH